jgi:uncharacterized DUF497 family protein
VTEQLSELVTERYNCYTIMNPAFEYDPEKNERNQEKHGLYLSEAKVLWEVPHVVFPARYVGEEARHLIAGRIRGRVYVAIFAYRGLGIRLISLHKADAHWTAEFERKSHEEKKD